MMPYPLHVAILVAISYAFYRLLLGKETFFQLNRWILLACMAGAFLIPLVPVPQGWSLTEGLPFFKETPAVFTEAGPPEIKPSQLTENPDKAQEIPTTLPPQMTPAPEDQIDAEAPVIAAAKAPAWPPGRIALLIYWCGVVIFGLNFLIQLCVMLFQMFTLPMVKDGAVRIVEWNLDKAPCSFGNSIFINPEKYDWETYDQIIRHEKIHIAQGHSLDILLAELLVIVQWFNPFAWQYRRSVEQNIEYLTDAEMLRSRDVAPVSYQMNLLKVAVPDLPLGLTTNYNQSILKKRILMMQSKKSSVRSGWKYLFLLPLFAFSAMIFNAVQSQNTHLVREQSDLNTLFSSEESDFAFDPKGVWQGTIEGDEVCMVFNQNLTKDKRGGSWSSSSCFEKKEFDALPMDREGEFHLKREAGQMTLTGKFEKNEGYGKFTFMPDPGFSAWLEQSGLGKPEEEAMIHLFFSDVTKDYVTYLKQKGFKDFSMDQLMAASIHGLDKKTVETYWEEWTASGQKDKKLEDMVAMKIHDLTPEYMRGMRAAGFKDASMDELLAAKIHDVTPEFVQEFKAAGYKDLDMDQIVGFKIHDVDVAFARSMAQPGGKMPDPDEVMSAKIHQVNPEDVAKFKAMGIDLSMEELTSFAVHGIDAAYVESWKKAGYKELDPEELMSAKIHEVTPEYLSQLKKIFPEISLDEAMSFKIHDVTPEFLKGYEAMGYKNIDIDELIGLKIHDVTADFINSFAAVGFKEIDLDEAVGLKIHGVTPAFIQSMRDKGFKDLSLDEYVSLKIMGSAHRSKED